MLLCYRGITLLLRVQFALFTNPPLAGAASLSFQYWRIGNVIDSIHGQRNPHRERGLAGMGNGCFAEFRC